MFFPFRLRAKDAGVGAGGASGAGSETFCLLDRRGGAAVSACEAWFGKLLSAGTDFLLRAGVGFEEDWFALVLAAAVADDRPAGLLPELVSAGDAPWLAALRAEERVTLEDMST